MTIHTWPEFELACVDVFVCDGDDPCLAIDVFVERFKPSKVVKSFHERGILR